MSETIEQAQEGLEHAQHAVEHGGHSDHSARNVAILIAVLAAALALTEMGEKAAQNQYLTRHISVSDIWSEYQARNVRATSYLNTAAIIDSLPGPDAEAHRRADTMRADAARMQDDPKGGNGRKQLAARVEAETRLRDRAFENYHMFELATGALQIAIVLASVSIVTRMRALTIAAAVIGGTAAGFGALVGLGLI